MKNYFLSGWMENLGVVPLFRSSAFLLAPIFFLLFFLMILVCLVFEAIIIFQMFFKKLSPVFVAAFPIKVKVLLPIFLCPGLLLANTYHKSLMVGEQLTLNFRGEKRYSIGNKKVIKVKYLKGREKLLVKAVKEGFTDLLVWGEKGVQTHRIQVHKKSLSSRSKLVSFLLQSQIPHRERGETIFMDSPLENENDWVKVQKFCLEQKSFKCEGYLSPKLKKKIISSIYKVFLDQKKPLIYCEERGLNLFCYYESYQKKPSSRLSYYLNAGVSFIPIRIREADNIKISFHFLHMELKEKNIIDLGLSHIQSQLAPFLNNSSDKAIGENMIHFENRFFKGKTLATPEVITSLNRENSIQIGEESAFQTMSPKDSQISNLQWKFSGFKLKFRLFQENQHLFIKYQVQFTSQDNSRIKGSKKNSTLKVEKDHSNLLFKMSLFHDLLEKKRTPFFSKLPLFGPIFKGSSKGKSQQFIIGFARFSYVEDSL